MDYFGLIKPADDPERRARSAEPGTHGRAPQGDGFLNAGILAVLSYAGDLINDRYASFYEEEHQALLQSLSKAANVAAALVQVRS